ncbi:MAG TPA: hypothetical protein VJ976_09145 [Ornithinimicrobium sp.]|uniref:hypothetical protein n=1 Tax=Ornithinimicrobium sp. TaxID=1977084 RepID=UPI002B4A0C62|nr:hypothetical protein [Ornithinimicrobium sp.]HKJ12534.1 hypothetical protein [Ornithinimicrobium sp.]
MRIRRIRRVAIAITASTVLAVAGCGSEQDGGEEGGGNNEESSQQEGDSEQQAQDEADSSQKYPDIESVDVEKIDENTTDLSVTVSSPYDTPERYADGWRVLDQDDEVLGEHTLMHDHADEQPFTRTQTDVTVPDGTQELTVEGRDSENGYGGGTVTVNWE